MNTLLAVLTLAAVWAWVVAHQVAVYFVLSVLIERLPPPDATSSKFYAYFYSVVQVLAANTKRSQDAVTTARNSKP